MIRPAVQPGSQIDFTPVPEDVAIAFEGSPSVTVNVGTLEPYDRKLNFHRHVKHAREYGLEA